MATFDTSIFINRPRQEVWDFITNPANHDKWGSSTESAEWTSDGAPGVGSTYRSVGKLLGRKIETTAEIIIWDPPNKHGHKSISGMFPIEVTMKFEPKEDGTQLNVHIHAEIGGFFKMAEGLVQKQLEKQLGTDFQTLKQLLEVG